MIRTLSFTAAVAAVLLTGCAGDQKMFRTNDELAQRTVAPPAVNVPARITREAEIRSSPHELSPVLFRVPQGTEVLTADQAARGWRRVKTQDGKAGYVQDAAVQVTGAAHAPAGQSAPSVQ
ncbi:MAG TPA: SH3 domain-containing protein [Anaeromyxobacteraceae bacterium]|nr:SH3 domain-containing protein [Anaeromyxobacteraceae bacterium]